MAKKEEKVKDKDKEKEPLDPIAEFQAMMNTLSKSSAVTTYSVEDMSGVVKMPRITTGSLSLDVSLGGGYPLRRIIEIIALESVGKTYLAYKAMAHLTRKGKYVYFADSEGTFDPSWAIQCGVDLTKVSVGHYETAEEYLDSIEVAMQKGIFDMVILDSIPMCVPKAISDGDASTETYAALAKRLAKMLPKISKAMRKGESETGKLPVLILINQYREKIGVMYGSPLRPVGGNTTKYVASVRLELKNEDVILDGVESMGKKIKAIPIKNKTAPPLRECELQYFYDGPDKGQFDNFRDLFLTSVKYGIIQKSGSWYTGIGIKEQGENSFVARLRLLTLDELNKTIQSLENIVGFHIEYRFGEV